MKLKLKRIALRDTYTIGKLYIDDVYFCDTIEDTVRDLNKDGDLNDIGESKVMHLTAIPYGTYNVVVNVSPRFKRLLPRLLDVPHFDGVLIHNGTSADSSSGCIIVGENKEKGKITNSTFYMNKLTNILLAQQKLNHKNTIEII